MSMISLDQKTAPQIDRELARRLARIRRRRKISQKELAQKSGVSLGSLKRFEQTGEVSLLSFTKIAIALKLDSELEDLFTHAGFLTIEEVINGQDH